MELENTYTYTARSAEHPEHLATFTLTDHQMVVDPGTSLQQVQDKLVDAAKAGNKAGAAVRLIKPAALWAMQRITQPFPLDDVAIKRSDDDLHVVAWTRAAGLRLAPVMLAWDHVDNNEAAEQFVAEVEARKAEAAAAGTLPGPLDYWLAWLGGAMALALGVLILPRLLRKSN